MAQITTEDLLSIITNMNEDPIPNHKCKEIIEALHKNSGKKKILPDTPPYDFLGNLNTTGCSLSINERLTEEPFLFRSLDIYFGSNDPIQNPVYMWGSVDFIHNPQGIWKNKIYPPAHLISVGTHLTLLDNGRWNRADVKTTHPYLPRCSVWLSERMDSITYALFPMTKIFIHSAQTSTMQSLTMPHLVLLF